MSDGSGSFLSRWSRRKLDERQPRQPETREEEGASPEPQDAPEPGLTPEEIAALPKIEELTAESDITVFLRRGVPEILKKAALRRMWSLDPAIRDYVGDARDYAYDWNVPGGVPGNGPLLPTDDVEGMVRQVFGREPGEKPENPARSASTSPSQTSERERPPQPESAPGPQAADIEAGGPEKAADTRDALGDQGRQALSTATAAPDPGAAAAENQAEKPPDPPPRRHGRARPV